MRWFIPLFLGLICAAIESQRSSATRNTTPQQHEFGSPTHPEVSIGGKSSEHNLLGGEETMSASGREPAGAVFAPTSSFSPSLVGNPQERLVAHVATLVPHASKTETATSTESATSAESDPTAQTISTVVIASAAASGALLVGAPIFYHFFRKNDVDTKSEPDSRNGGDATGAKRSRMDLPSEPFEIDVLDYSLFSAIELPPIVIDSAPDSVEYLPSHLDVQQKAFVKKASSRWRRNILGRTKRQKTRNMLHPVVCETAPETDVSKNSPSIPQDEFCGECIAQPPRSPKRRPSAKRGDYLIEASFSVPCFDVMLKTNPPAAVENATFQEETIQPSQEDMSSVDSSHFSHPETSEPCASVKDASRGQETFSYEAGLSYELEEYFSDHRFSTK